MRKKAKRPDAKYDHFEEGKHWFRCLRCSNNLIYEPWEIVKHLKASHRIPRKRQIILSWNKEYEENYQKISTRHWYTKRIFRLKLTEPYKKSTRRKSS
jgi:hypothetical protein